MGLIFPKLTINRIWYIWTWSLHLCQNDFAFNITGLNKCITNPRRLFCSFVDWKMRTRARCGQNKGIIAWQYDRFYRCCICSISSSIYTNDKACCWNFHSARYKFCSVLTFLVSNNTLTTDQILIPILFQASISIVTSASIPTTCSLKV